MSIPLWVSWSGIPIHNSQVTTIPPKGFAIKLKTIIRDEGVRDPKPSDNIFPNKSLGIHVPDICQWFNFNPLSEVICADQQPHFIPCCFRERSNNIQGPLNKGLRAGQRIKDSSWLMNVWGKSLALVTFLHIFLCFLLHVWPPISLCKGSVRQGSTFYMAFTNPFM